jgi:hypothetical protein
VRWSCRHWSLAGLLLFACLAGGWSAVRWLAPVPTSPPEEGPVWFRDVTDEVGLNFTHDAGPVGAYFLPQIMGSGAAFIDLDGKGQFAVYLLQGGGPEGKRNQLFRQRADGTFEDVSRGSGLDIAGYNTGVAVGDVNNDGYPDVLVAQYGGIRLFLNQKNGTFADVTEQSGLVNLHWATSVAFLDFDNDGWLDLVVVNYLAYDSSRECFSPRGERDYCFPGLFPGTVTRLFRNKGRQLDGAVLFEDVTERAGLSKAPGPGLGVICADFDGDGWPDIFVANDAKANHLWINQRNGTFKEEAVARGVAFDALGRPLGNMGIALGDVDGDGLFDLLVTHLVQETHTLWMQGPRGQFQDRTSVRGVAPPGSRGTGFGTVLADFDNDGSLDLAIANGGVIAHAPVGTEQLTSHFARYAQYNQLFANDGKGHFTDLSAKNPPFCRVPGVFRGLVCADLRGEGSVDLLVTAVGGKARLYRNVVPDRGNWLVVRAFDPALHRDAYGAEVTVEAQGKRFHRWLNPASSYECSSDPRLHFGLRKVEKIDRILVRWPGGVEEEFPGGAVNRQITLNRRAGSVSDRSEKP